MRDLNPKVAADDWGTLRFKFPFLHLLILSPVLHTFLKIKIWNKKYKLRMNTSTHSASFKKTHVFLKSLVEGHFFILYFSV